MDIKSGCGWPAAQLSNFAGNRFTLDGVQCNSMEGFLQSLKFKNPEMQIHVCALVGKSAKFKGKNKNWWRDQKLWWKGTEIDRHSVEYQKLLDRAFEAMFNQSESFRKALIATQQATITHSIGKNDPSRTVLTQSEFCSRLLKLRDTHVSRNR